MAYALFLTVVFIIMAWDAAWKGIGMWHSAKNSQVAWFVCILIFNTIGILPILYLALFQKKPKPQKKTTKKKKK